MRIRSHGKRSALVVALLVAGCGGSVDLKSKAQPVLDTYATNLYAAYSDAVTDEQAFSTQLDAFLAAPTEDSLATLRTGWLASRAHYMLTEGARFYDGPIDVDPPNYEALVNSWPLDEAYVDYTTDANGVIDDTAGIVNHPDVLATITSDGLDALNAQGGDANISDGYHAQEFLLWGQALQPVGPGTRPASDYETGGPRPNVDRRKAYLRAATDGVLAHLMAVRDAWAPGAPYRTTFLAGGLESVALALTGLGKMSKGELGGQRIDAPYASKSRRDQHDCFSSDTLVDYDRDAQGLLAMYLGSYGSNDGPGFDELVASKDATVSASLRSQLDTSVAAIAAIPPPFEASIVGDDSAPGRVAILAAVNALRAQGDGFANAAKALGLSIIIPDTNP
jgi:putative iron-regulated protein